LSVLPKCDNSSAVNIIIIIIIIIILKRTMNAGQGTFKPLCVWYKEIQVNIGAHKITNTILCVKPNSYQLLYTLRQGALTPQPTQCLGYRVGDKGATPYSAKRFSSSPKHPGQFGAHPALYPTNIRDTFHKQKVAGATI
jgi:hypothetical protein